VEAIVAGKRTVIRIFEGLRQGHPLPLPKYRTLGRSLPPEVTVLGAADVESSSGDGDPSKRTFRYSQLLSDTI
jgi:hypothetical protein